MAAMQLLQKSLLEAHKDLTSTNDAIRRLTGRDPDVRTPRPGPGPDRRVSSSERRISSERRVGGRMRSWSDDMGSPAAKRRDLFGGRSRLAGRLGPRVDLKRDSDGEEERDNGKPSLQSSVIATVAPPRPKADPHEDNQSKTRNRRMFGFLMGTLQKFKENEESVKQTQKERRRQEIEEKLQRVAEVEKEVAMQERRELFEHRKSQQSKLARLETHMGTVQMYEEWNDHDRLLRGYIKTRAQPPIFFRPAQHVPRTEELQQQSTAKIEELIRERQKEVESILADDLAKQEPMEMREGEGEGSGKGKEGKEGKGEEMEEGEIKGDAGSESGEISDSD